MENQTDDKVKLTVDEQITDMRTKNVQFEICSIEDAKKFLKYNNYYFKLKSYARNYVVNPQTKKYYNLDFAYLVELSKLDMHIRKIILEMSLDVEHYLKVRLMNDLSNKPQLIIEVVSEHFQISLDQMISKNRSKDIARPRQIAMYLCKNMTDTPLDSIGALLGGRDHSTIIHGVQKISDEYESDETTRSLIDTIKKKINPN